MQIKSKQGIVRPLTWRVWFQDHCEDTGRRHGPLPVSHTACFEVLSRETLISKVDSTLMQLRGQKAEPMRTTPFLDAVP